jgi:DNA processing protein
MSEREAWVALASTPGVGDVTFHQLLAHHGSATAALERVARLPSAHADRSLAGDLGMRLRPGLARAIREAASDTGRTERRMLALGGWLLTPLDAAYPPGLHAIEEPPVVLYGIGDPGVLLGHRLVAVVGTRRPTAIGRDLATRIGMRLAQAGSIVVSGLAVGIDGAAHLSALDSGARTIAVVGGGLDDPGPAPHRRLARRIMGHGAVVGELAPGVRPTQGTFPRRNRIISALATATIVVEAPARSGALITARHALEQGRQLLVAPGRPLDPRVAGNLALLRESPARPLVGLDEMIADLGYDAAVQGSGPGSPGSARLSAAGALELLEPTQRAVARVLAGGPRSVDGLCRATGLDAGVVAASLTMLQLRGWARVLGATQLPAGPLLEVESLSRDPERDDADPGEQDVVPG